MQIGVIGFAKDTQEHAKTHGTGIAEKAEDSRRGMTLLYKSCKYVRMPAGPSQRDGKHFPLQNPLSLVTREIILSQSGVVKTYILIFFAENNGQFASKLID